MNEYTVVGTIWFWALMVLIAVLHVCTRLFRGRKTEIFSVAANTSVHIVLFFLMFLRGADVSELFLALLMSLCAALLCRCIDDKAINSGKNGSEEGE